MRIHLGETCPELLVWCVLFFFAEHFIKSYRHTSVFYKNVSWPGGGKSSLPLWTRVKDVSGSPVNKRSPRGCLSKTSCTLPAPWDLTLKATRSRSGDTSLRNNRPGARRGPLQLLCPVNTVSEGLQCVTSGAVQEGSAPGSLPLTLWSWSRCRVSSGIEMELGLWTWLAHQAAVWMEEGMEKEWGEVTGEPR